MVKKNKTRNNKSNGTNRANSNANGSRANAINPMQVSAGLQNLNANYRPVYSKVDTLTGSDYYGPVIVKATTSTASSKILATIPVSPSTFPGTRLTQLSNLWERYRFTKFNLRYVSAVPNTLACQLVLYIDTDPTDDPNVINDADALVRQAVAQTGAQQWNFNMSKTTPLAMRNDDQMYYTGIDKQNERFTRQATAYVIQITDPINFNGQVLTDNVQAGSLFIDWTVCFQIPQINPSAISFQGFERDAKNDTDSSTFEIEGLDPEREYQLSIQLAVPDISLANGEISFTKEGTSSTFPRVTYNNGTGLLEVFPLDIIKPEGGKVSLGYVPGASPADFSPSYTLLSYLLTALS